MLHDFIAANRDQIITRCRQRVAMRPRSTPSDVEMDNGVPIFLDQLVNALRSPEQSNADIGTSAAIHGHDLLLKGFTVSQVVHDYGDVNGDLKVLSAVVIISCRTQSSSARPTAR